MRTRFTNRKRTLTLAAALAMAALLPAAAPANAQGGWRDRGDRGDRGDRQDGRYGDRRGAYGDRGGYGDRRGYDGRGGYGDAGQTRELARRLARQAHALHLEAERINPRPNPPVANVLASLHRLDESASRLASGGDGSRYRNERGDSRARDSYRGSELNDLLAAYDDVRGALSGINPQRYLREGIASIDALVGEISRYGRDGRDDRRDGYGRDGEGRGGRDGYSGRGRGDGRYDDGYGRDDGYDDRDGHPRR